MIENQLKIGQVGIESISIDIANTIRRYASLNRIVRVMETSIEISPYPEDEWSSPILSSLRHIGRF